MNYNQKIGDQQLIQNMRGSQDQFMGKGSSQTHLSLNKRQINATQNMRGAINQG